MKPRQARSHTQRNDDAQPDHLQTIENERLGSVSGGEGGEGGEPKVWPKPKYAYRFQCAYVPSLDLAKTLKFGRN
jgi:hypothetical protein